MSSNGEINYGDVAKSIVNPIIRKLMDVGSKAITDLKNEFIIESQDITFLCPENLQKWSMVCRVKKGAIFEGHKTFKIPVRKASLKSIVPSKDMTDTAIRKENDELYMDFKPLDEGTLYVLDLQFNIPDKRFLDSIISRDHCRECPYEDRREYWVHADLKFLDIFEERYSSFKIEDIDFNVDVAVSQEIKASIPNDFKGEIDVVSRWLNSMNPEEKGRLSRQHLQLKRASPSIRHKKTLELLSKIQDVFTTNTFRNFVDVQKDFDYHDCNRGTDFYSLPFPTWPKFMEVVSRASLNLKKPAVEGLIIFSSSNFKKEVEKAFE